MKAEVAVGIDAGHSQFKVAALLGPNKFEHIKTEFDRTSFPSVMFLLEDGMWAFAEEAENWASLDKDNAVHEWKLFLGTDKTYSLRGRTYTPADLSAAFVEHVVKRAQEHLGVAITRIVLTTPACFRSAAKKNLKQAVEKLGYKVRLLSEPAAAGMNYFEGRYFAKSVTVFDCGAGTTDYAVLRYDDDRRSFEILSKGAIERGGMHMRLALQDHILSKLTANVGESPDLTSHADLRHELEKAAERAKLQLSVREDATVTLVWKGANVLRVTRSEYEAAIKPIVDEMLEGLRSVTKEAGVSLRDAPLTLVGGASKTPLIRRALSELTGDGCTTAGDAQMAVARGASLYAARVIRDRGDNLAGLDGKPVTGYIPPALLECAGHAVGLLVRHGPSDTALFLSAHIRKGQPLPGRSEPVRYNLTDESQGGVFIQLAEGPGDGAEAVRCSVLAEREVLVSPRGPRDDRLEAWFQVDLDGIATAHCRDLFDGKTWDLSTSLRKSSALVDPTGSS